MNPNPDNLTDPTLPDAAQLTAPDGGAAVAETLSLAELNSILGKDFKDKATALKSVKDTYAYVGTRANTVAPAAPSGVSPELEAEVSSLKEQMFYANHPEYKGHEAIIKAMGSNPAEVVNGDAFKTYFEKATVADQVSRTKSVVASNPRIAQATTHMDAAREAAQSGNTAALESNIGKALSEAFSQ